MTLVLEAVMVLNLAVFLRICWIRWTFRRDLNNRVFTLLDQLSTLENRFKKVSALAYSNLPRVSEDIERAMKSAQQILDKVHNFAEEVLPLAQSKNDRDWGTALSLIRERQSRREVLLNWKELLERHIQEIGRDVCRASERNLPIVQNVASKRTSTMNQLVELGVRAAVIRVRLSGAGTQTV